MAREEKSKAKAANAEKRDENASAKKDENIKQKREKKKKEKKERVRRPLNPDAPLHQVMPILLTALAALFGVCIYTQIEMGLFGSFVSGFCFGILGGGAYAIPVWLIFAALRWRSDVRAGTLVWSQVFGCALIFLTSVLCYTFGMPADKASLIGEFYALGKARVGGGFLGGLVGFVLCKLVSKVGTTILAIALLFAFFLLAYGAAVKAKVIQLSELASERAKKMKETRRAEKEAKEEAQPSPVRNERVRTETSFYDTLPAVVSSEASGERTPTPRTFPQDAGKPAVKRSFFDADADSAPMFPSARATDFPDDTRSGGFLEDSAVPQATPVGMREGIAFSDDAEIHIVSNRPIPSNPKNPFGKGTAAPQKPEVVFPFVEDVDDEEEDKSADTVVPENTTASEDVPAEEPAAENAPQGDEPTLVINKAHVVEHIGAETLASTEDIEKHAADTFFYSFPPLSLLHEDDEVNKEDSDLEIAAKADKLRETLHNFGVAADITCVSRGPRLTRYELVPRPGVRISKIENLVDEITMNLEAISVRIEAPIPGKAAIGVEVPNINTTTVRLRGLLDTDTFRDAPGKTTVCLGVDVVGKPVFADLDKMPHLLVAGATGMGKSVCINSLLISLLYKARPDEVKLILIDPKKVEFQSYANIPHLLVPVVTEPQKAAGALSWAVNEMERRYDLIENALVRNIVAYNKTVDDHPGRVKLPQIVIVIDELHDLMLQARDAVEDSIARIAAKARAAGILLIIGTQRPSVNVITGVIKANIPSRIAFHVASQVDSRTILDAVGAEKLLNNGDMLFLSPGMKMMTPKRVQGAFLDDDEVNRVADYLRKNSSLVQYDESVMADMERESEKCNKDKKGAELGSVENGGDMGEDDLFYKAVEVALESGKISTSLLQRRLSLGFGKAARIIDRMCDLGIVSPPNGQKPREVLITMDEYRAMRLRRDE